MLRPLEHHGTNGTNGSHRTHGISFYTAETTDVSQTCRFLPCKKKSRHWNATLDPWNATLDPWNATLDPCMLHIPT